MKTLRKLKILVGVYTGLLLLLLLCVGFMPLLIRNGVSAARNLIIEEDVLETALILLLFGLSLMLLRGLLNTLKAYRHAADHAAQEKKTLMARLAEAFHYIGTVNVEIQEIESVLGGIDSYPQSKRELQRCFEGLATKAMAISGSSWSVIRIIDHRRCRMVKECRVERRKGVLPTVTMGNRDILEGHRIDGRVVIAKHSTNIDFLTVCILPDRSLVRTEQLMITAILSQFEMLFLLHRSGYFQSHVSHLPVERGLSPGR